MKRLLACFLLLGFVTTSFATDARIIALGRHDAFFMDDYSIFRNPANVSIYPNMMMASMGYYAQTEEEKSSEDEFAALRRTNRDPIRPWGGGVISYSFNQSAESGSQYPMFSLGVALNRHDEMLEYITPFSDEFQDAYMTEALRDSNRAYNNINLPEPVGKFDVLAGYALKNGGMLGIGTYLAFQNDKEDEDMRTSLYRVNLGLNWPLAKSIDMEVSGGIGVVNAVGDVKDTVLGIYSTGSGTLDTLAVFEEENNIMARGDVRLFSALTVLNGDFVPHLGIKYADLNLFYQLQVALGFGVNINVDKGFGWAGAEFIYEDREKRAIGETSTGFGGRIGFGFERNIVWDWLLLRGGVMKKLLYVTEQGEDRGYWEQNAEADASDDDFAGFGIGLNIENRLRVDCVLADDILYTFTNLISGPQHHLQTRFTFTFSF
ncbi:MAG: hypothetical protein GF401_16685 [Chitinivibrionales bacterium]|nr:hypothetical protein [Chitinivibrionales bacterium]